MTRNLSGEIDLLYGPPLDVISNTLRGMIVAAPGHDLLVADFASIEARGVAWLAGAERMLDVFRTGADIYCHAATDIYGFPVNKKEHPEERQIGKVVVLACIAGGEPVLTSRGLVPIQEVTRFDRVWDGVEWVQHGGVVFRGKRHLLCYDGLRATHDHLVMTPIGWLALGRAVREGLPLIRTAEGVSPVLAAELMTNGRSKAALAGPTNVYDIVEAGPRNRFTASGVLVHNCGYQGSVGAFQAMARGYGVKVPDAKVKQIVSAWRGANPEIVAYWKACEEAAIKAVENKGSWFAAGPVGREVKYLVRGSFLFCLLPSGRALSYPYPKLVPYIWVRKFKGLDLETKEADYDARRVPMRDLDRYIRAGWEQNGEPSPALHYRYVDPQTKQWVEGPTYGGSLVENITQAVCRDILAEAIVRLEQPGSRTAKHFVLPGDKPDDMPLSDYEALGARFRAEVEAARAAGYPVIFHVHDEVVSEVPEGEGDVEEFESILAQVPAWGAGFPIEAEGFRTKRYRK